MWSIPTTHPKTVSQSGRITVFTKPHGSQTIIGEPCRRPLSPARFSGDLLSSRRAHQQERLPPIYLPVKSSSENSSARAHTHPYPPISSSARDSACGTFFTHTSSKRCVCRRQAFPSTPWASPSPEKPFFFSFLYGHCYWVHLSPESPLFLCFLELYDIFRTLGVDFY